MELCKQKTTLAVLFSLVLLILTTSACVERVVERPAPPPAQAVVYVQKPPPAEIVEVVPAPPGPANVWVWQKGHWRWDGYNYHWFPGHWVQRPPNVTVWVAPHWEARGGNGFVFVEGTWR